MSTRDGPMGMVQQLYDRTIRPRLPRKLAVLNGVTTRQPRLFDATDRNPDYEAPCVESLRTHVTDGDDVVVIGGGFGVSAVAAARAAEDVSVDVFEGSSEHVDIVDEAVQINSVQDDVTVRHAIVSDAVDVWGETGEGARVAAGDLPDADVLEIDAEGAELRILEELDQRPRVLIVESHGHLDSPTSEVRASLDSLGYQIQRIDAEAAEQNVMVLTAVVDEEKHRELGTLGLNHE